MFCGSEDCHGQLVALHTHRVLLVHSKPGSISHRVTYGSRYPVRVLNTHVFAYTVSIHQLSHQLHSHWCPAGSYITYCRSKHTHHSLSFTPRDNLKSPVDLNDCGRQLKSPEKSLDTHRENLKTPHMKDRNPHTILLILRYSTSDLNFTL